MFANEHEERTYNWLRALPLTPRQLFIAKFTAALLTTIAMALVLARIIHEFDRVRRKPFVRNELRLSYLFHTAPAATLARMRKRGERRWFHERTECR